MSDETWEDRTVALPDEENRTDEATVSLPAQRAESTPERVTADEPTAVLPETLAAPADQPEADDGVTASLPDVAAEAENNPVASAPSPAQTTEEPEPERAPADATIALPAVPDPEEPTTTLLTSPKAEEPDAAAPENAEPADTTVAIPAAPADTSEPADATVAIPPVPATGGDDSSPEEDRTVALPGADGTVALPSAAPEEDRTVALPAADGTVALPSAAPEADRTVALPPATPAPEPAPASPGRALLSRRRLLLGGAGVAAAAVTGGIVAATAGRTPNGSGSPIASAKPATVTTTKSREPEATALPVPAQRKPIFTLSDYRKATGAGPFPADAIALTIDDGPHPIWTPKILHLLDQYHVPAMFCMIGNQVLGHEDIAKMVTGAGHQLANHTWSHPTSLDKKTGDTVRSEVLRAQEKIHRTTGYAPKFFRSPGGAWSPVVLQQTAAAGLLPLDWTNDPKDWAEPGVGKIEHTMLAARPGQILLCHDGGGDRSQTYNALKVVLPQLKARGLRFVAL